VEVRDMTINVDEKFTSVGIKTVDSKNRINLGEKILNAITPESKADAYKVFIGNEGDILLRPVIAIPAKEAWIYENPEVLKEIRQGLTDAKEGKTKKAKNLNKFLKDL